MRTPTAVSADRLARYLSLRFPASRGRLVALLLGEAAPDAVDLPGPQRERETLPPLGPAQMVQPPDQLEVLTPGPHLVDGAYWLAVPRCRAS